MNFPVCKPFTKPFVIETIIRVAQYISLKTQVPSKVSIGSTPHPVGVVNESSFPTKYHPGGDCYTWVPALNFPECMFPRNRTQRSDPRFTDPA